MNATTPPEIGRLSEKDRQRAAYLAICRQLPPRRMVHINLDDNPAHLQVESEAEEKMRADLAIVEEGLKFNPHANVPAQDDNP